MSIDAQVTGQGWLINAVANAPATSTSPGQKGDYAMDEVYLYVCIATNQWKRITLEVF